MIVWNEKCNVCLLCFLHPGICMTGSSSPCSSIITCSYYIASLTFVHIILLHSLFLSSSDLCTVKSMTSFAVSTSSLLDLYTSVSTLPSSFFCDVYHFTSFPGLYNPCLWLFLLHLYSLHVYVYIHDLHLPSFLPVLQSLPLYILFWSLLHLFLQHLQTISLSKKYCQVFDDVSSRFFL